MDSSTECRQEKKKEGVNKKKKAKWKDTHWMWNDNERIRELCQTRSIRVDVNRSLLSPLEKVSGKEGHGNWVKKPLTDGNYHHLSLQPQCEWSWFVIWNYHVWHQVSVLVPILRSGRAKQAFVSNNVVVVYICGFPLPSISFPAGYIYMFVV